MIIVSSFKLEYNEQTGFFSILADEECGCPLCSGELAYRNSRERKSISNIGEISLFLLRRLRCLLCKKLHTEIPDTIQPYRHYDSAAIQSVLEGAEDATMCVADDSTMRRWKASFAEAEPHIGQRLDSIQAQMTDGMLPLTSSGQAFKRIKASHKRWLPFVMGLLINRGHGPCTRFAFCPPASADRICKTGKMAGTGGGRIDKTFDDTG